MASSVMDYFSGGYISSYFLLFFQWLENISFSLYFVTGSIQITFAKLRFIGGVSPLWIESLMVVFIVSLVCDHFLKVIRLVGINWFYGRCWFCESWWHQYTFSLGFNIFHGHGIKKLIVHKNIFIVCKPTTFWNGVLVGLYFREWHYLILIDNLNYISRE